VPGRKSVKKRKDPNPAPYVRIIRKGDPEKVDQACRILMDYLSDEDSIARRAKWGRVSWEEALEKIESVLEAQPTAVMPVLTAYQSAWEEALAVLDARRARYLDFRTLLREWYSAAEIPDGKNPASWLQRELPRTKPDEAMKAYAAIVLDPGVEKPADEHPEDVVVWPHDYVTRTAPLAADIADHFVDGEVIHNGWAYEDPDRQYRWHCWLLGARRFYWFGWSWASTPTLARYGVFSRSDVTLTQRRILKDRYLMVADTGETLILSGTRRWSKVEQEITEGSALFRYLSES